MGRAARAGPAPRHPHLLRQLGRHPGQQLLRPSRRRRRLPLAVLLAAHHDPGLPLLARASDPSSADPLSRHLLLLPQGLLPLVLPRSAGVCGGRAARARLPRRDRFPLHPAEPPPLRVLHHVRLPLLPLVGRDRGDALRERLRHRRRHARAPRQHERAHPLQLLVPLRAPPDRRQPRLLLVQCGHARPPLAVEGRQRAQRAPHGLRLDQLRRRLSADLYVRLVASGVIRDLRIL